MMQHFDVQELARMQALTEADGRQCVVGGVVINGQQQAFVQKRSASRRLFPNCWDLIGGHVEEGETLEGALIREIDEETGWKLSCIRLLIYTFHWETEQGNKRREFDFLVQVEGDLASPQLEWSKNSEFRWLALNELEIVKENRAPEDIVIYEIVKKGLGEFFE